MILQVHHHYIDQYDLTASAMQKCSYHRYHVLLQFECSLSRRSCTSLKSRLRPYSPIISPGKLNLAWSKLILNDYPVYGLAVYGLARGPGHRFHIKYLKLKVLGPSFFQTAFTFRPQQIQTPGKQKSGRKCLKGVWQWTCQSKPLLSRNQAESA